MLTTTTSKITSQPGDVEYYNSGVLCGIEYELTNEYEKS